MVVRAEADHIVVLPPPPATKIGRIVLPDGTRQQIGKFYYGLVLFVGPKVAETGCSVEPGQIVIFDAANMRALGVGGDKGDTPTFVIVPADVFVSMDVEDAEARGLTIPDTKDAAILASVPDSGQRHARSAV